MEQTQEASKPIWQRNPAATAGAGVIALAFVAWLAFGFFGIHTAFTDDEVDEAGPLFNSQSQEEVMETEEFQEAVTEAEENRTEADDDMPMPGEIQTLVSGEFTGNSRYDVAGQALVLNDGTEQRFLRFEDFDSSNGPDLKVYLRAESGDFVNLGELKGNIGDQNYEIPVDVDLDQFNTVEIWCERFSVGFGQATLA